MPNSQRLHDLGLKVTLPRLKILEIFEKSEDRHLGAEDIYRLLVAEGLDIGLATVYRVLTQFEHAGILDRHAFKSGKATFEINEGTHHDHIVCIDCGHVEEFCVPEIERLQKAIASERGFEIEDHAFYLYARCSRPGCPRRLQSGPRRHVSK